MNRLIASLQKVKKPAKKRVQREHNFQVPAFEYAQLILPDTAILTSIDHANPSRIANALNAKRGVLKGIPDIWIAWSSDPTTRLFVNAWMECKALDGRLTKEQEVWRDMILAQGGYWCAPRTIEDVDQFLRSTPIPLRNATIL